MTEIRECDAHGYVAGDACPICLDAGTAVLGSDRRTRLSKFLSGALRHFPDDAGLELDDRGWTPYDELVDVAVVKYDWARPEHVAAVIATDPKGRFERDGDCVRAAYGHSVEVDLDAELTPVPDKLYHGTAPENLASIREEGLRPMNRQKVHLSESTAGAREVGRRHAADPAVLAIDVAAMQEMVCESSSAAGDVHDGSRATGVLAEDQKVTTQIVVPNSISTMDSIGTCKRYYS